jgi:hypothetical protein
MLLVPKEVDRNWQFDSRFATTVHPASHSRDVLDFAYCLVVDVPADAVFV